MSDMFSPPPQPDTELGRYRILSSTAGIRVSPLCLGAMSIGDAWTDVSLLPLKHLRRRGANRKGALDCHKCPPRMHHSTEEEQSLIIEHHSSWEV